MKYAEEFRAFARRYVERVRRGCPSSPEYRPVRVSIHLGSPLLADHPWLSFDSLCLALMMAEFGGPDVFDIWYRCMDLDQYIETEAGPDFPWPILRDRYGLFHASVGILSPEGLQARMTTLYKRFCSFHAPTTARKKRIQKIENFFGDRMVRHVYMACNQLTFYAMAHAEILPRIMQNLIGLGPRFNVGFGTVQDWTIEETAEDYSLVYQGLAMRPIPVRMLRTWEDSAMLAWKPPYWRAGGHEECCVPFTKAEMEMEHDGATEQGQNETGKTVSSFQDFDFFNAVEDLTC